MLSLLIQCPQCGRELKLPDRSYLGRKGKCSKCGHSFILREPTRVTDSVTEQFANLDRLEPLPIAKAQTPQESIDIRPSEAATIPDFASFDQMTEPTGTAARLKELHEKSTRQRNIGLVFVAVIVLAVGSFALFGSRSTTTIPLAKPESVAPSAAETPTPNVDRDSSNEDADPEQTDYAQRGSPTSGEPIALQYIPFGTQVVINLRPAELWKEASLGAELRLCVPPLAAWIESTVNDLFKCRPVQIEELLICLIPGQRGSPPDIAAVAHWIDEQNRGELIEKFGGRVDTFDRPVYVSLDRAYLLVDAKTVAVCPLGQVEEMIQAVNDRHPNEQLDPLLPLTDRDRQLTILLTPLTLGLHDSWFPEAVRPLVKQSLEWLDDETESVSCSIHVQDGLFYSDILLRNKKSPIKKFEQEFRARLSDLAAKLVPLIQQMDPVEQGRRMLIGRLPAMVEVFSMATICHRGSRHVRLITPLPDRAAPNLFLATYLAWDQSTTTDFSKGRSNPTTDSNRSQTISDRLQLRIAVDFRATPLSEAFNFISGEIKTPIEIDGEALKSGGFTKNLKQTFQLDSVRVQDAIARIFQESKTVESNPEKKLVIVVDENQKNILVTTQAAANKRGLTPVDIN